MWMLLKEISGFAYYQGPFDDDYKDRITAFEGHVNEFITLVKTSWSGKEVTFCKCRRCLLHA